MVSTTQSNIYIGAEPEEVNFLPQRVAFVPEELRLEGRGLFALP